MTNQNPQKKVVPIYPILFAIYPVFFLYSYNIAEVEIKHTILPLLFSVMFAALVWAISHLILKNRAKSAAGAAVFIILFFLYGHIFEQLKLIGIGLDIPLARHSYLLPLFLIAGGCLFYIIGKSKRNFNKMNYFLNTTALFLILFNIFSMVHSEIKRSRFAHMFTGNFRDVPITPEDAVLLKEKQLPDIYYIILDEYAAPGSIKRIYNYDSSPFVRHLEQLGFYIATRSKTKYKSTGESIASSLNMDFLKEGDQPYVLIQNNRVMNFLKNTGYKIITFPLSSIATFKNSDDVFDYSGIAGSAWLNRFYVSFLETTMLKFLCAWDVNERHYVQHNREKVLFIFKKLAELASSRGPKFIYAHIVCPHPPFVFDRSGDPVDPAHVNDLKDKKYYLDQYVYINKKVKDLLGILLKKSKFPPVIIVQSDHGPRGTADFFTNRFKLDVGDEWRNIFNAYYLSGGNHKILYPTISPYNTFRLIFNHYFNTRFPLLKD